jgi:hypothetical protein
MMPPMHIPTAAASAPIAVDKDVWRINTPNETGKASGRFSDSSTTMGQQQSP